MKKRDLVAAALLAACSSDSSMNSSDRDALDPEPWSESVSIVESHGRLAIDNRLHIVGHIGQDLVHRSSQDDGATWNLPTVIAPASSNYPMQYGGLYAQGDTLYLLTAVGDMGGVARHSEFRKSIDNGETWTDPVRITVNGQQLRRARIVAHENFVHVAGLGTSGNGFVVYFRSSDGGASWLPGVFLVDGLGAYGGGQTIAVDGNVLHVPYTQVRAGVGGGDTYYIRSDDNGQTWSSPVLIGEQGEESDRQARVQVVAADDRAVVIWQREAAETGLEVPADRLGYNLSRDGGITWGGAQILPDDHGVNREHQHIWMTSSGWVHVGWWNGGDSTGTKSSSDYGETWGPSQTAIVAAGSPVPYSLVADDDWVHFLTGPMGAFQYARRPLR